MRDVARDLAEALRFAVTVTRVLSVDDEADRMAAAAMYRRAQRIGPGRKIARRA